MNLIVRSLGRFGLILLPVLLICELVAYNLAYALVFATVPVLVGVLGDRGRPLLERINRTLTRVSDVVLPFLLVLVALALLADGIAYFATGAPLFGTNGA